MSRVTETLPAGVGLCTSVSAGSSSFTYVDPSGVGTLTLLIGRQRLAAVCDITHLRMHTAELECLSLAMLLHFIHLLKVELMFPFSVLCAVITTEWHINRTTYRYYSPV